MTDKKKRIGKITLFFLVIVSIIGLIIYNMYNDSRETIYQSVETAQVEDDVLYEKTDELTQKLENKEPIAVMILGSDVRQGDQDKGRADTIMVATINPTTNQVDLLSIPRDTHIQLAGTYGIDDKINATHAYGGIPYLQENIEQLLNIPIDGYAMVNFDGFVELVDAVGGVDVNAPFAFNAPIAHTGETETVYAGEQTLDGDTALGYVRMRKEDPRGDFGRQERQREVVRSLVKKLLQPQNITRYNELADLLAKNIETNVTSDQADLLIDSYISADISIDTVGIDGTDNTLYLDHYGQEVYLYEPDANAMVTLQVELQNQLQLPSTYQDELNDNYDHYVEGFPFYSENAMRELDLPQTNIFDNGSENGNDVQRDDYNINYNELPNSSENGNSTNGVQKRIRE